MKIIFSLSFSVALIGCSIDSPVSGTFCYQKDIGYHDLQNQKYEKYYEQWLTEACTTPLHYGECGYYEANTTIRIEECVDGTFTEK